jgi:hypothetical protein
MGLITPLAIMVGIVVLMVAPGFALKRVNARDESGSASPDALVMVLGVAGLALLVLAAVVGLGLEHGSAVCSCSLVFGRATLLPRACMVPHDDWCDVSCKQHATIAYSLGTLYRDGLDEQALRAEEQAARSSARTEG